MIPIVTPICCERNQDCIIAETCQDAACGNCSLNIYNRDGTINTTELQMTINNLYTYTVNISQNLTSYGVYPYTINCTTNRTCLGDCQVEVKSDCGRRTNMELSITLFLLAINILCFALPFWVTFSKKNEVTDYVVKRLLWIASLVLLWFNTTIFRTMAENYGLNIDNFLVAYWWFFTLGVFMAVFIMVYVTTKGALMLIEDLKMRRRMGYEEKYARQKTNNNF